MNTHISKIAITALILLIGFGAFSQGAIIPEDEVSIDIQKWFYLTYPNSEQLKWTDMGVEPKVYKVEFLFENEEYVVHYDDQGYRKMEQKKLSSDLPLAITNYLYDLYPKFKVNAYYQIADIPKEKIRYKVQVKTKDKGKETIFFDQDYTPFETNLVSNAAN